MHVQIRPVKYAYADILTASCLSAWGMDVEELLRLAMRAAAISRDDPRWSSKLAKALKLEGFNSPQRVRRWMEGETKPDYDGTVALLELAGLLGQPGHVSRLAAGGELEAVDAQLRRRAKGAIAPVDASLEDEAEEQSPQTGSE